MRRRRAPKSAPSELGVPTADDTAERILRSAAQAFLRAGYERTTVDEIAMVANSSKRTIYGRYADKTALFSAVIDDRMADWRASIDEFSASHDNLYASLAELARHLTLCWSHPNSVEVQRLIITEKHRWPDLGTMFVASASRPAIALIEDTLRRHRSEIREIDLKEAAEQFFGLAVERHQLNAHLARLASAAEIARRTHASVDIFLRGVGASGARAS